MKETRIKEENSKNEIYLMKYHKMKNKKREL